MMLGLIFQKLQINLSRYQRLLGFVTVDNENFLNNERSIKKYFYFKRKICR